MKMSRCATENCYHEAGSHCSETGVCMVHMCLCQVYIPQNPQRPADIDEYRSYIQSLHGTNAKIQAMLDDIPEFRNLTNKEFVFVYWHYHDGYVVPPQVRKHLTEPDTIRRAKQKLVEENPKYLPDSNTQAHKETKEMATKEYVTMGSTS